MKPSVKKLLLAITLMVFIAWMVWMILRDQPSTVGRADDIRKVTLIPHVLGSLGWNGPVHYQINHYWRGPDYWVSGSASRDQVEFFCKEISLTLFRGFDDPRDLITAVKTTRLDKEAFAAGPIDQDGYLFAVGESSGRGYFWLWYWPREERLIIRLEPHGNGARIK